MKRKHSGKPRQMEILMLTNLQRVMPTYWQTNWQINLLTRKVMGKQMQMHSMKVKRKRKEKVKRPQYQTLRTR